MGYRTGLRPQIRAESADLLEHFLAVGHISAEWSLEQLTRLWTTIEDGEGRKGKFTFQREPSRRPEVAFRQNAPSCTSPLCLQKNGGKILQPLGVNHDVI